MSDPPRPVTVMLTAIGGEGGGVLAGWIVEAARIAGLPVQSTFIPGVAQRTGATTHYMEIFPMPVAELDGNRPVMALYPGVGDVDVMLASEFVEAGRAMANGFITPDRTTLIASTHRVWGITERGHMADGRFDGERLLAAVAARTKRALLADLRAVAMDKGVSLNAVILGVLATSGLLPIPRQAFEDAIAAAALATESNLKGFAVGMEYVFADAPEPLPADPDFKRLPDAGRSVLEERLTRDFPDTLHDTLRLGVARLTDYQDAAYGSLYLGRLAVAWETERGAGGDGTLTREVARRLAVRMSYEDVIRVAQLKVARNRFQRVRDEAEAGEGEPVVIIDYFKPGMDELRAIVPPSLAGRLGGGGHLGLRIRTSTVSGFLLVWLLAKLKFLRRRSFGYRQTQDAIGQWLDDVARAIAVDLDLAFEVASCAQMIKGYGNTFGRGSANLARIREQVIEPALSGRLPATVAVDALANARVAALADPEGRRLAEVLDDIGKSGLTRAAE